MSVATLAPELASVADVSRSSPAVNAAAAKTWRFQRDAPERIVPSSSAGQCCSDDSAIPTRTQERLTVVASEISRMETILREYLSFSRPLEDLRPEALDLAGESVRQARKHAAVVIVMIHAGAEGPDAQHVRPGEEYYLGQDRGNSIAFTHAVIDAGASLVMGSGPHVLRAMQWYRGHLIAYSLGNFCGYNTLGLNGVTADSAILHVTLRANGSFVRGSITPIVLSEPGIPAVDPARTAVGLINSLSQDDFGGNGAVRLSASGRIESP